MGPACIRTRKGGRSMTAVLVVISVVAALAGGAMLSQATQGVGVICIGVAFGVWARIAQAAAHRKEALRVAERDAADRRADADLAARDAAARVLRQ